MRLTIWDTWDSLFSFRMKDEVVPGLKYYFPQLPNVTLKTCDMAV